MDIDPFIAALRNDRVPQRQAQAAMDVARKAWQAEPGAFEMMMEMGRFGEGAPLGACPMLDNVFTQGGEGERIMVRLSHHYCAALRDHPIGHPPFRHGFNGLAGTILLARSGRAQLTLQSREPGKTVSTGHQFSDAERFDAVLAGVAEARIVRARSAGERKMQFDAEHISLRGGARLGLDLNSETLVVESVSRRLVILRLSRSASDPQPVRDYDAATGELLMQSAGALATSRQEAITALLGRMGRCDAAPLMAKTALDCGDASLRWQSLRECLALDSEVGFRALVRLARRAGDPLAAPAGALRAQLLEANPQFATLETV
ncbi:hypothetical protein [Aurantiacibacter marinus]|uniref:Uncharacterized protein n=1 Tax=Aurantiacibacter marinus TaxID=874156 RepID=A0A0H0XN56_9SPHN|nr:hypothetical protein [Aurantiacibacter marinus]KLI63441.1 hypothetical protein AAV99_06555 [Aurantiacibacter marinus]